MFIQVVFWLWFAGVLLPNIGFMAVNGLFPNNLTLATTVAGIAECILAALAGAAVYKEGIAETARSMAARA